MNGPPCSACNHKDREQIDSWLRAGRSAAVTGRHFGLSDDIILRHRKGGHIKQPDDEPLPQRPDIETTLGFARAARAQDANEFKKAQVRGDWRTMAAMSREMRLANRDIAELEGDLVTGNQVNVMVGGADGSLDVAVAVLRALQPYPEARQAVLLVLSGAGMTIEAEAEPALIEAGQDRG